MDEPVPACDTGNEYDGQLGLRISAIFVILVGSGLGPYMTFTAQHVLDCDFGKLTFSGALFPVFANRHRSIGVPDWVFFFVKYFGSGVIVATAFIHVSGCLYCYAFTWDITKLRLTSTGLSMALPEGYSLLELLHHGDAYLYAQ